MCRLHHHRRRLASCTRHTVERERARQMMATAPALTLPHSATAAAEVLSSTAAPSEAASANRRPRTDPIRRCCTGERYKKGHHLASRHCHTSGLPAHHQLQRSNPASQHLKSSLCQLSSDGKSHFSFYTLTFLPTLQIFTHSPSLTGFLP